MHELGDEQRAALKATSEAIEAEAPVALTTLLDGPGAGTQMVVTKDDSIGSLGMTELLDKSVVREARGFLDQARSTMRRYSRKGEVMGSEIGVSIQAFSLPPAMVIFGAIDFSASLAKIADDIGYRVTIVDAREAFLQSPRFQEHAETANDWPDRYMADKQLGPNDAVLVFTHDPKFDEPALLAALQSDAGYIGALGSRRTQTDREERLRAKGIGDDALSRGSTRPAGSTWVRARRRRRRSLCSARSSRCVPDEPGGRLTEASGPIHSPLGPRARGKDGSMEQKPSEQRGGTTPDEAEAHEKGEWAAKAQEGVVPAELGGSDAPGEMLDEDPELQSSVLGETTGSDEPATEEGIDPSGGDEADAVSDGGPELPEDAEPDLKDIGAASRGDND